MMSWFRGNGNTVFGASKLSEAKSLLSEIRPDILVLDVILPDGSGLDLLTFPSLPPVVILSDLASEENILAGLTPARPIMSSSLVRCAYSSANTSQAPA